MKNNMMNPDQLTAVIADKTGLSKVKARAALDAVNEAITEAVTSGDRIRLVGVGIFSAASRAAKAARNPKTGETVMVPAHKTVKFKPSAVLLGAVNLPDAIRS